MLTVDRPTTRLALVNLMPDAAFEATERQFLDLIRSAAPDAPVDIRRFSIPGIERGSEIRAVIRKRYLGLDALHADPPDALIITGTEPLARELEAEPFWDSLTALIRFAEHSSVSTVLSCLAAHAALVIFDGIERRPLPLKCSGVFEDAVMHPHPLVEGIGDRIRVPHSRLNDVTPTLLDTHGYATLMRAGDDRWSVAVKQRSRCLFVLCQGHLEYGTDTLLREYRRDVRRFLARERSTYPGVPVDYLAPEDATLLAREGSYPEIAARLANPWRQPAEQFYANWLRYVSEHAHHSRERVGS